MSRNANDGITFQDTEFTIKDDTTLEISGKNFAVSVSLQSVLDFSQWYADNTPSEIVVPQEYIGGLCKSDVDNLLKWVMCWNNEHTNECFQENLVEGLNFVQDCYIWPQESTIYGVAKIKKDQARKLQLGKSIYLYNTAILNCHYSLEGAKAWACFCEYEENTLTFIYKNSVDPDDVVLNLTAWLENYWDDLVEKNWCNTEEGIAVVRDIKDLIKQDTVLVGNNFKINPKTL